VGEEEGGQGQEENVHQRRGRRRWRRQGRERGRLLNDLGKAKPEMFDAWIEKGRTVRTVDTTLKWEAESAVPLSATLFTTGSPGSLGPVRVGRDSVDAEEKDEEKKKCPSVQQMRQAATGSNSTLQVAVFLQMPSPPPSHTVTEEAQNDLSVRGELAIGLVEAPWTRVHPSSRQGEETTAS